MQLQKNKWRKVIELRKKELYETHIAYKLETPARTVNLIIERAGLSRAKDIAPLGYPPQQCEHDDHGDMICGEAIGCEPT